MQEIKAKRIKINVEIDLEGIEKDFQRKLIPKWKNDVADIINERVQASGYLESDDVDIPVETVGEEKDINDPARTNRWLCLGCNSVWPLYDTIKHPGECKCGSHSFNNLGKIKID